VFEESCPRLRMGSADFLTLGLSLLLALPWAIGSAGWQWFRLAYLPVLIASSLTICSAR
jgi:hypothetical protein